MRLLDTEGETALGVRRLARELGVAHSAPANHFPRKSDLLTAVAVRCFEDLENSFDSEAGKSGQQRLRKIADGLYGYAFRFPQRYRFMFRPEGLRNPDPHLRGIMERLYAQLGAALSMSLKGRQPDPERTFSVDSYAISLWSMLHGYILMRLDGNFEAGRDELAGLDREQAILELWLTTCG